jgi:hypothetical protein
MVREANVLTFNKKIAGSGSFPLKARIKATWMIAIESPPQADLRPLGIVLNEQLYPMIFS